jgi:hypothetical protein
VIAHAALLVLVLLAVTSASNASGYRGDPAVAWNESSIVLLGRPREVGPVDGAANPGHQFYEMEIEKAYKGQHINGSLTFFDPHFGSTASMNLQGGTRYVVFLQTRQDRDQASAPRSGELGEAVSVLKALKCNDKNLTEIEAAIQIIRTYETLAPAELKRFLLEKLPLENPYSNDLIVREIIHTRITEALPYFRQKLANATSETDRLNRLGLLRSLGEPVRAILIEWLADDAFTKKAVIIEEMVKLNDKSLIPEIRKYVNAENDYVKVSARSALLRLGETGAKALLLEVVQRNTNPIARYNAMHSLHWDYTGGFSTAEKMAIRGLLHDKDENVARVASFLVEKWKPSTNLAPDAEK